MGIGFGRGKHQCQGDVAIAKVLESLPLDIRDCRIDVQVDNQAVIHTWTGRGGRSRELAKVTQHILRAAHFMSRRGVILLILFHAPCSNQIQCCPNTAGT